MKIFGKKEEVVEETPDYVKKIEEQIEILRKLIYQTQSDYNFGAISEEEYTEKMEEIKKTIEVSKYALTGEVDTTSQYFNEMMGNPIEWLNDLFNTAVHKKIDEIDEGRKQ